MPRFRSKTVSIPLKQSHCPNHHFIKTLNTSNQTQLNCCGVELKHLQFYGKSMQHRTDSNEFCSEQNTSTIVTAQEKRKLTR